MLEDKLNAYSTCRRYCHSDGISSFPKTLYAKSISAVIQVDDADEKVAQEPSVFSIGLLLYCL